MVGFISMYYDDGDGNFEYSSYGVFKFMIDRRYQGKGYGKEAMVKAIEFAKASPHGKARVVELTYKPENVIAKNLLQKKQSKQRDNLVVIRFVHIVAEFTK